MEATFEIINKEKAINFLRFNKKNRLKKRKHVTSLAQEMTSGRWKQNAQPIVFSKEGDLIDGQHRLSAIVLADYEDTFLVVRGAELDSKVTIDTRISRGLHDVLQFEGFKSPNSTAALIKGILGYEYGNEPRKKEGKFRSEGKYKTTNSVGLEFANVWTDELFNNVSFVAKVKQSTKDKQISPIFLSTLLYIIGGHSFNATHTGFIKTLLGINTEESSGSHWIRKTVQKSKDNNEVINTKWLYGVCIKAWNLYINGNPAIRYMKFDASKPLPKSEVLPTIKEKAVNQTA